MTANGPPRIAHVIYRLDFGGLENGLVNLVNRIPEERYQHTIICLNGYSDEFRSRLEREDVDVLSLGKRPGKDPGAYFKMWQILRRLQPEIVHTRNLGTVDMQCVAAAAGVHHRVHGEHGWEASDPIGQNSRNLRIRRACRPVIQLYVPMSRDIARWLERDVGVDPRRIRQLYSGVDTERFSPQLRSSFGRRPETAALARVSWGDDSLVIGTVGRLDPVKNHASLLRAFRSIRDRRPDFASRLRLAIVGDGPLRGALESLARELGLDGNVVFMGARTDVPDVMRSFDLFVLPSVNEGVSNTILEAMATGLPVVAGRVGGNPELIVEGITGALYDPGAAGGLADALLHYLDDPLLRNASGAAGRERVVRDFSLEAMVQGYLDVYDGLLREFAPGAARAGVGEDGPLTGAGT